MAKRKLSVEDLVSGYRALSKADQEKFDLTIGSDRAKHALKLAEMAVEIVREEYTARLRRSDPTVRDRILKLRAKKLSYGQVAIQMNADGIRKSNGTAWTAGDIKSYCHRHKRNGYT